MSAVSINVVRRFTIATGEPRHRMHGSAVKLTSGEILVTYREGSDHWRTPDAEVKMVRSSDNGESWSDPEPVFSEPGWGTAAHHSLEQLSDGRVILPLTLIAQYFRTPDGQKRAYDALRAKVYVLSSEDGGSTWSEPMQIGPMEGWSWQNQYGRVQELPDGRVFIPGGGQKKGEASWYSGYFVSHDRGRTFTDRVDLAHGIADEIDLARLHDGRWMAMVRDLAPPFYLHQAYSDDEGRTWSNPVRSGIMGHCPSFLVLPSGTVLLGYRQVDPARSAGFALSTSTDGGATWELAADLYVAPNNIWDCSYPSMVLLEDGRVFCVYYSEFVNGNSDMEGLVFEVSE